MSPETPSKHKPESSKRLRTLRSSRALAYSPSNRKSAQRTSISPSLLLLRRRRPTARKHSDAAPPGNSSSAPTPPSEASAQLPCFPPSPRHPVTPWRQGFILASATSEDLPQKLEPLLRRTHYPGQDPSVSANGILLGEKPPTRRTLLSLIPCF